MLHSSATQTEATVSCNQLHSKNVKLQLRENGGFDSPIRTKKMR
jgi:hypothetical protein